MLVLTRKEGQRVMLSGGITLEVLKIRGDQIRLGVEAPPHIKILREELLGNSIEIDRAGRGE